LIFVYCSIVFFTLAFSPQKYGRELAFYLIGFFGLSGAIGCFVWALYNKSKEKRLRTDIEDLEFEIELAQYPQTADEQKSERLFRRSERELSKYYGLNLIENRSILYVGVLCILVSLVIVVVTLGLVFSYGSAESNFAVWTKGIVAVIGAMSAIMVNVVAAIYLQMYAKSSEAFGQFHDRLVRTHELFLANMLITRVGTEKEPLAKGEGRQALLGAIAKDIATGAMRAPSKANSQPNSQP
jgi:hypothetical protein